MTRTPIGGKEVFAFVIPLVLLILVSGFAGVLCQSTYARETPSWTAQGVAQDMFDVAVLSPLILAAAFFVRRGSRPAHFILFGSLVYSLYTFVIYCFALHFNPLFLVYCGALGLSFYAILYLLSSPSIDEVKGWFDPGKSVSSPAAFLIAVAVLFYALWLAEDLPAVLRNRVPNTLLETGLTTNPVHVLDLAFLLPGTLVSGLLLRRKHPLGYLFGTSLFPFLALMSLSIGWMVIVGNVLGVSSNIVVPYLFALLFVVGCVFFVSVLGNLKKEAP